MLNKYMVTKSNISPFTDQTHEIRITVYHGCLREALVIVLEASMPLSGGETVHVESKELKPNCGPRRQ